VGLAYFSGYTPQKKYHIFFLICVKTGGHKKKDMEVKERLPVMWKGGEGGQGIRKCNEV
jgi:hypothetical protein